MISQECYLAGIKLSKAYTDKQIAVHNELMHNEKQDMQYYTKKIVNAKKEASENCYIDINKIIEVCQ